MALCCCLVEVLGPGSHREREPRRPSWAGLGWAGVWRAAHALLCTVGSFGLNLTAAPDTRQDPVQSLPASSPGNSLPHGLSTVWGWVTPDSLLDLSGVSCVVRGQPGTLGLTVLPCVIGVTTVPLTEAGPGDPTSSCTSSAYSHVERHRHRFRSAHVVGALAGLGVTSSSLPAGCLLFRVLLCLCPSLPRIPHHWVRKSSEALIFSDPSLTCHRERRRVAKL